MRGRGRQRRQVAADQIGLAIADEDIRLGQIGASGPQALDLPAFEHEPCLEALFDEKLEPRPSIDDDGRAAITGFLFA